MRVNNYLMPFLVIAALLASVLVAKATGAWSVSGKDMIDVQQLQSGDDVRGWMTLQQLSEGFGIPSVEFYALLGIPEEIPPETALKDMESILADFEVSTVRDAIDAYLEQGGPSNAALGSISTPVPGETPSPGGSASESSISGSITPAHIPQGDGSGSGPTPPPDGQILPGVEIKGRHTLQEIVDQCKVPAADLLASLGLTLDADMSAQVKDLIGQGNIDEVQSVRDIVAKLQAP